MLSPTALEDAKQLVLNAFDENADGRIDIAEVMDRNLPYALTLMLFSELFQGYFVLTTKLLIV